jgi:hypothetical protein
MAGPDGGWVEDAFDHARDLVVASPLLGMMLVIVCLQTASTVLTNGGAYLLELAAVLMGGA